MKRFAACCSLMLAALFVACDENYRSDVPDMRVNFSCSLQQAPYSAITSPGQYLTVTKKGSSYVVEVPGRPAYTDGKQGVFLGFGGLIIGYPAISMEVGSRYVAYDRACPMEARDLVISRLELLPNSEGKCPKCGTVYDLDTGFPKKGTATQRLRTYQTVESQTVTGTSLVIRN